MTNQITVSEQKPAAPVRLTGGNIFGDSKTFELAQRMANALSQSTIVPKDYQGKLGNCLIALEMASRLNTSPLMVMQNLYVVNGRPAWSSQYIVAMINSSKKYQTELQYEIKGSGMNMSCYAYADDYNGHRVTGPTITMELAKKEGWLDKTGSKWKTMPEVMIRYRAASFFGRLNCPDMIMGLYSSDEIIDIGNDEYEVMADVVTDVETEIAENANQVEIGGEDVNIETGEVLHPEPDQIVDANKKDDPTDAASATDELFGVGTNPDF